jgi:hypothetical protein
MSETPERRNARKNENAGGDRPDPPGEQGRFTLARWLAGEPLPRELALVFGLVMPAMLLAVNMWRVHTFTIDDSYISYRYARNLARGLGLVYNAGERIEGYTNFLFTVILAGGIKLGIDPEVLSKGIGAGSAFGALGLTYAISGRIMPYRTLPCVATWLLASTIVFTGWSVFGLETGFFLCLILAGTYLLLLETGDALTPDPPPGPRADFPWSGLVFALAGLTRPEAPMFFGLLLLFLLGRGAFGRQNLLRVALFVVPIALHLIFRHAYYGAWLPNTLAAKTGNFETQYNRGLTYVQNYVNHTGPVLYLAFLGGAFGLVKVRRDVMALAAITLAVLGYVILVGGDWMKLFRFMSPFEPFCFLLIDLGVRRAVDKRDATSNLAVVLFASTVVSFRSNTLRGDQVDFIQNEKRFWDTSTGGTARWFLEHPPGEIALGDIGYVGWVTDYPILDLLGLVDPVISKLPGDYAQKIGPGFTDRLFEKKSRYALIISSNLDCQHPSVTGSQVLWADPRFRRDYQLSGKVPLDGGFAWCFYERRQP